MHFHLKQFESYHWNHRQLSLNLFYIYETKLNCTSPENCSIFFSSSLLKPISHWFTTFLKHKSHYISHILPINIISLIFSSVHQQKIWAILTFILIATFSIVEGNFQWRRINRHKMNISVSFYATIVQQKSICINFR